MAISNAKCLWLLGAVFTVSTARALAVTIDFDEIEVTGQYVLIPGDTYIELGIVFQESIAIEDVQNAEPLFHNQVFSPSGGTSPNALALVEGWSPDLDVEATFFVPGTTQRAVINHIQVDVFDDNVGTSLGTLEAFDACGDLIESVSLQTPDERAGTYEITASGIAKIRLTQDQDGGLFDNFVFATPLGLPPVDSDHDGLGDDEDNCPMRANCAQRDTNGDGIGNACDADLNNDCTVNFGDLAALKAAFNPLPYNPDADFDGDGLVNFGDLAFMKATFFNGPNPGPGPGGIPNVCDGG